MQELSQTLPRSPASIIDDALDLVRRDVSGLIAVTGLWTLPATLGMVGAWSTLGTRALWGAPAVAALAWIGLACGVEHCGQLLFGAPIDSLTVIKKVARRLPTVLMWFVLLSGATAVLGFFLLVPATATLPWWLTALPVHVLEPTSPTRPRTSKLLGNRFGAGVGMAGLLVGLAAAMALAVVGLALPLSAMGLAPSTRDLLVGTLVATGAAFAVLPVLSAVMTTWYVDLRIRNDGLDVQLLLRRAEATFEVRDGRAA